MKVANAIVVGGGIGGLAVAAALSQRGVAVTLLEQAKALTEVGAGLQISPNGLVVLRALGVEPHLKASGAVVARAVSLRDHADGAEVARLDLARLRPDQTYYFLHRADLVDALHAVARRANVTIELGRQVASMRPGSPAEVQLTDGSTRRAEVVVAADGIHSVARPLLNGPDKAQFSGQVAWRGMVPNTTGHPPEAQVHMGPGRHLVSYPVRGSSQVNLVAVEERDGWAGEGWHHSDDPAHLRRAFAGFGGKAKALIDAVEAVNLWGLHLHPVAKAWQGRGVALLGDAAHPTLPFLAQGANLALEDAWVLATLAASGRGDWLLDYERMRAPRVRRVIAAAARNAWRYHLHPGPVRSLAHLGLRTASRMAPGRMIGAFDWLYGYDVTAAGAPRS